MSVAVLDQAPFGKALKMAPKGKAKAKSRPKIFQFSPMQLAERLSPLATLRDAGFSWRGDGYQSQKRGQSIDGD